jgi:hypothetical protein
MRARPSDIADWQRHGLDDWTVEQVVRTLDIKSRTQFEDRLS